MKEKRKNSKKYIEELESEILEQNFQLKVKKVEINSIIQSQKKRMRKLTHNLKNPVGIIYSFSDMILEDIEVYDTDKLKKHVGIIKNAADFSIHFLNQTSKLSNLMFPGEYILFKKLNVVELLNQLINKFDQAALKHKISIKRDFQVEKSMLLIHKEHLLIALSNIISNALRFSFENTTIMISVVESEDSVEIVITDEGIGVGPDDLLSVFHEYYVVNTYSNDKIKCVGLGLTIAEKIIEIHKGSISFESTLDKGSSVKIKLPKDSRDFIS